MKLSIFVVLLLGLAGCTQQKACQKQEDVASVAAQVVVLKLNCTNAYQVQIDLQTAASKVAFCAPAPSPSPLSQGRLGSIFVNSTTCNFFGSMALNDMVNNQIPDSWGCNTSLLTTPLDQLLSKACNALF